MKSLLLSACAAALIAATASSASAGQFTMNDSGPSGGIIAAGDSHYYDNDYQNQSQGYGDDEGYGNQGYSNGYSNNGYGNGYDNNGYGNGYNNNGYGNGYNDNGYGNGYNNNNSYGNGYGDGSGYGNGYGHGYGNGYGYAVLPAQAIVRFLHRNDFSYISQPVLSGRFYQVKALDPRGRKVKLYVDAFNGRIAKVKY
jgi:hypothetical protein